MMLEDRGRLRGEERVHGGRLSTGSAAAKRMTAAARPASSRAMATEARSNVSTPPPSGRKRRRSLARRILGWIVKAVLIFLIGSACSGCCSTAS